MDKNQLIEKARQLKTQANFILPDGTLIPAGINPGDAATINVEAVLTAPEYRGGTTRQPLPSLESLLSFERGGMVPQDILAEAHRQISSGRVSANPKSFDLSTTEGQQFAQQAKEQSKGLPSIDTTPPSGSVMKEFTTPSGAKVTVPVPPNPLATGATPLPTKPVIPQSTYTGPSIIDYLNSVGQPSDFASRANLAKQYGIQGYTGSAQQNTQLLNTLRSGGQPSTPASVAPQVSGSQASATVTTKPAVTSPETPDATKAVNDLLKSLGVSVDPKQFQVAPTQTFQDVYKDIYKNSGLDEVKTNIESTLKQITDLENQKADEITSVNDNPWLSETLRSKKITSINEKYERKTAGLTNTLKLYQGVWDSGREDARFIAQNTFTAYYKEREFQADQIKNILDRAEDLVEAERKANDIDTQVVEVNGVKQLINSKTGTVISTLGKATKTSDQAVFNTDIRRALVATGLDNDTINLIEEDIQDFGFDRAVEGSDLNDAQKKLIKTFLGGGDVKESKIPDSVDGIKTWIRSLFNETQLKEKAKEKGFTRGGTGALKVGVGTEGVDDYLTAAAQGIMTRKSLGLSDDDIIKELLKEKMK